MMFTISYKPPMSIIHMENHIMWDKMVHASFGKVIKFDLLCMAMGVVLGMGAGAYLVASGLFG